MLMWAVLAVAAFAVALILHITGGHAGSYVTDFTLAGLALTALHLAWAYTPWRKP
jgi:hypothetical protein